MDLSFANPFEDRWRNHLMPQQWAQTGELVHAMAGTLGNPQPGEMENKVSGRGSFPSQNGL